MATESDAEYRFAVPKLRTLIKWISSEQLDHWIELAWTVPSLSDFELEPYKRYFSMVSVDVEPPQEPVHVAGLK